MAIQITCPGCKTRFKVSDQFAGKKGPCPKCKTVIQIPAKGEEVVIHGSPGAAVEGTSGAVGGSRAIPQPIFREDKGVSPIAIGVGVASFLGIGIGTLIVRQFLLERAIDMRGNDAGLTFPSLVALAVGAFFVGIPTSYYGFRAVEPADIEKMPVQEALVRSAGAAAAYAALWGLFFLFKSYVFEKTTLELYEVAIYAPIMVLVAGGIGMVSFNLDYVRGLLHGGFYIGLCVALRIALGLGPF